MKNLYIIGNGFDLHHNLNTSYFNFREYLHKIKETDILEILERNFDKENLWSNFEESLGEIDINKYVEENFYDLEYSQNHSKYIGSRFVNKLKNYLCQWMFSINTNTELEKINHLPLNIESTFLTFNYTDTLETVYKISEERIIYLHGKCKNTKKKIKII